MDKKLFGDLPFGTRFIFYGKTYTKIALNMAEDEKRYGNTFQTGTEVEPIECDPQTGILDLQ
ncbi:MAG: hypothetical protein DMG17_18225 [Acidobacteria bacterium]|nr:MAG: hypothetical protein DMG17_18225 [Acidobacteriota bacterium]PYU98702.1 MAG: hypothetical protein DMG10_27500 [Acidobacteriota bacterium]